MILYYHQSFPSQQLLFEDIDLHTLTYRSRKIIQILYWPCHRPKNQIIWYEYKLTGISNLNFLFDNLIDKSKDSLPLPSIHQGYPCSEEIHRSRNCFFPTPKNGLNYKIYNQHICFVHLKIKGLGWWKRFKHWSYLHRSNKQWTGYSHGYNCAIGDMMFNEFSVFWAWSFSLCA